jgi:membrane protease subunit (stomatin/prohibitin family)
LPGRVRQRNAGGAGGGIAGDAMGLGAGVALGQVMAQQLGQGLQQPAAAVKPDEVVALLEKLGELKAKGVLTEVEFAAKKAELLKKLG